MYKHSKMPAGLWLRMILVVAAALLLAPAVQARPKEVLLTESYKNYEWKALQKNNFFHSITNYGILGQTKGGSDAYAFWPAPAIDANGDLVPPLMNYVYGWGLWIGGQVRSTKPGKTRDTLCTVGYNPNNGTGEFVAGWVNPDGVPQSTEDPNVKIYSSLNADWPIGEVVLSVEDTKCQYNDFNLTQHAAGGRPLKVEVTQTTYQWNYPSNQDIIFFKFEVRNAGTDTLFDVYLAPTSDCDIADESGTKANDVCYFDSTTNMSYQYQTSKTGEQSWTRNAGCVGFMFLESPKATKDYTFPDMYKIYKDSTIGLTAFKVFNINIDPSTDLDQYKELAGYNYQTGEFKRFDPKPAPGDQRFMESTGPIDMAPGATAATIVAVMCANFNYAYLNVNDNLAIAELRAKAMAARLIYEAGWLLPGPPPAPVISLTPGHRQVIVSWDASAENVNNPKNKNLLYYQKVTSDSTDINKFDPNFLANTFQGYKLFKSTDGSTWELLGQWDKDDRYLVDSTGVYVTGPETLKTVKKINDTLFTTTYNPNWIGAGVIAKFTNSLARQSLSYDLKTQASNSGLQYSYVDQNLINGFTYYYAVSSYGLNWQGLRNSAQDSILSKEIVYFETSRNENTTPVIPRSEPNDYVGSTAMVTEGYGWSFNRTLIIQPNIDLPRAVKAETFRQIWGATYKGLQAPDGTYVPKVTYMVKNSNDSVVVPLTYSSVEGDTIRGQVKWSKSIKYTPGNFISIANRIYNVNPAGFAIKSVTPHAGYCTGDTIYPVFNAVPNMKWAFRTGTFEIRWFNHNPEDPASLPDTLRLWPQVWHIVDSVKNIMAKVPYDSTILNNCTVSSWNLGGTGTTLGRRYMTSASSYFLKFINIAGMRIFFNNPLKTATGSNMIWSRRPAEGDVWRMFTTGITIPTEGEYQVINTTEYQLSPISVDMSRVKVVPNPYIVRNIWERTNNRNKLQFVNLPSKCSIKIYTIAGNLIKILEHDDNAGISGGTCWWDPMLTMNQQNLASGVYLYYVDAPGMGTVTGKFAVVR